MPFREGLFVNVRTFIRIHLLMAIYQGMLPIIDMQNWENQYLPKDKIGKENSWEYYFEQPFNVGLNDIKNKKIVYGHQKTSSHLGKPKGMDKFWEKHSDELALLTHRFLRLNSRTEEYVDKHRTELLGNKRTLAVIIRGTDYTTLQWAGHAKYTTDFDYINQIKQAMHDFNCEQIFVATEELKIYSNIERNFPEKVCTNPRESWYDKYYETKETTKTLSDVKFDRENDEYLRGLEYVTTVYLASQCNSLIYMTCGSSRAALQISAAGYENIREFTNYH